MGNRISVQYTKFVNLDEKGSESEPMFGFRVYDDYASAYNNTYESFDELKKEVNEDTVVGIVESMEGFDDAGEYPIYLNGNLVNDIVSLRDEDDE
jgi:hypothetical protein